LLAAALSACATPPAIDPSQLPATPASYKNPPVATGRRQLDAGRTGRCRHRGDWWLAYQDSTLNRLIDSALQHNTDLAAAAARLQQARAALGVADADRMPQLGVNVGNARGTQAGAGPSGTSLLNSSNTTPVKLTSVGANFSYEIDLAGRLSGASPAAALDAEASAALLQGSRLLIASQVAQSYFSLRLLDQQRQLLQDTVQSYARTAQLTRQRYQAGEESGCRWRVLNQTAKPPAPRPLRWTASAPSWKTHWRCCWANRRPASIWKKAAGMPACRRFPRACPLPCWRAVLMWQPPSASCWPPRPASAWRKPPGFRT
jgi:hypothetical protein